MNPETLIASAIGTAAGTILALVFIQPKTLNGFVRRLLVAVIFGPLSAPFIAPYLLQITKIEPGTELRIGAHAAGAFCSWWLLGAFRRIAERLGNKEEA